MVRQKKYIIKLNQIEIKLPRPYDKQIEILNDKSRFKVLCVGRRSGKTTLCLIKTILSIIQGKRVAYITPEFGLGDKLFNDISLLIPKEIIATKNKSRLKLELKTKGTLSFFSGEALDRCRGWEFDLLIVDEAAHINDLKKEWDLSLRPLLMKTRGEAIFVSSPYGKNFFYSLFQKGVNGDDGFKSWQFSTHFNPYIPKKELEELIQTLPEAAYRQEILAEPGENSANPFGTDAITKGTLNELSDRAAVIYGIDFGRVNDWTVITGLDDRGHTCYFDRFKLPWELTITRVKELREMDPYTMIVVDSTGVGSPLLERLQASIDNVFGFEFTGKSKPVIIYDLIKDVESGVVKFNEMTAQEMSTFEYKYTAGQNITFNAASGYHDDCIASLAMANYYRKKHSMNMNPEFYVF